MTIEIQLGTDGEFPPGWEVIDPAVIRAMSFREWIARNGGLEPDDPAHMWLAWYLDYSAAQWADQDE